MNYILKRNFNPKTYAFTDIQLERFDDEQLNSFKSETENTAIIIYETTNINDEHLHKLLNEYEITKIVWKRHNTPHYNNQRKIEVAFIPEQIDKMNEEAEQIIQQINLEEEQLYVYNKELEKLRIMESRARNLPPLDKLIEEMTQKKEEMNKIITSEMTKSPNRFTHIIKDPVNGRYRRLVPVELERLNMFPDNHTAGETDSKRGFFMGNALVCGVVEKVGKVIRDMFFDV